MDDSSVVNSDDLPLLIQEGVVEPRQFFPAVRFFRNAEFWKVWALRALFALAVGHILSGVVFFFAFNWNDLSGMAKFAVVGGGILASVIAWVAAKLDSAAGQAFGIAATVLVGVMFAVMGQVYQTPAMIHTPFVYWAVLTLPFALASRNLAHWAVWITIAVVAVTTYANSGLRLAGDDDSANFLNVLVSGGFVAGLIGLDKIIAPRLKWARAEWFRVLLVMGAMGFAFFGFTESFWDRPFEDKNTSYYWILAIALICGLVAYLYKLKPTLATLSLATFGLFTLIAQFGFKLFDKIGDDVGVFFLAFLWLGGLMVAMVFLFKRYMAHTKTQSAKRPAEHDYPELEAEHDYPTSALASHLKVPEPTLQEVLDAHPDRNTPWYMSLFLALAGILTALFGFAFFGSLFGIFLSSANGYVFGGLGLIMYAGTIFLRRKTRALYVQHILNTLIIVSGIVCAVGFGIEIENFDGIIALLIGLSLIVLVTVRDKILEFLSAAAIITLVGVELYHVKTPMVETIILAVSTLAGVFLLTRPIRRRLYHAAGTALLMAPALVGIGLVHIHRLDEMIEISRFSDDWLGRVISLILLVGAVVYMNRGQKLSDFKPPLYVLAPLVIAAAMVPLGGASALLMILSGYILGSRTLAILGTLLQIYFLTMFYYDLSLDLLTKSIILFVTGLIFLCVWVLVNRKEGAAA